MRQFCILTSQIFIIMLLIVAFQNCGEGFQNNQISSSSETPIPTPPSPPPPPAQKCEGANCLPTVAANLAPGEVAAFDVSSFGANWVNGFDMAWNQKLNWDPVRRQLHFHAKRHSSVGNNARYIRY